MRHAPSGPGAPMCPAPAVGGSATLSQMVRAPGAPVNGPDEPPPGTDDSAPYTRKWNLFTGMVLQVWIAGTTTPGSRRKGAETLHASATYDGPGIARVIYVWTAFGIRFLFLPDRQVRPLTGPRSARRSIPHLPSGGHAARVTARGESRLPREKFRCQNPRLHPQAKTRQETNR